MTTTTNGIVNSLTSARLPRWVPWSLLAGSWAVMAVFFGLIAADSGGNYNIVGVAFFGIVLFDILLVTISYLVEGFGEDILPTTMDFNYVDEIVRVTDRECFITTRRLVREEGIFAGGSAGGAVAGAIRYAEQIDAEVNIVVLLPDSASRYLSKIFDDEWMRANGFLDEDLSDATVADVLASKSKTVYSTELGNKVSEVVKTMKEYGISQLPVLENGKIVGIINEGSILDHLLADGSRDQLIDDLVETQFAIVDSSNRISLIGHFFRQNKVVIVVDNDQLSGIITKIDFIDYVSNQL